MLWGDYNTAAVPVLQDIIIITWDQPYARSRNPQHRDQLTKRHIMQADQKIERPS